MITKGRGVVMNRAAKLLVIFLAVLFAFSLISSYVLADKPEQTGQDKNKEKKQKKDKDQDRDRDRDRDRDGDDDPDDDQIMDDDEEQEFPPAKGLYKPKNNNRNEVKAKIQLQNAFRPGAIRELIQDDFEASFEDLEIESPLLEENITADVYVYIKGSISGSKVTTPSGRCNLQAKIYDASGIIVLENAILMNVEIAFGMLNMHSQVGDESENSVDAFFRAKYLEVTDSNNPFLPEDLIVENALIRIRDGKLYFMGSGDAEGNGSPAPPRSNVRITTFARIKSGQ
jgi:Ni/Co efflux regulator RcnB